MNNTETVICDLSNCRNLSDLHRAIYDALDFPDYYGNNLDALWDVLWSSCPPKMICFKGVCSMSIELQKYFCEIKKIFQRNKEWQKKYNYEFDYEVSK